MGVVPAWLEYSVAIVIGEDVMVVRAGDGDIVGVEIGGALKNVVALAAGVSDGLGFGYNTRAALITRGLAEMVRLGIALGARAETLSGLSGLGDLALTAVQLHGEETPQDIAALRAQLPEGCELWRAVRVRDDRGLLSPPGASVHVRLPDEWWVTGTVCSRSISWVW